MLREFSPQAIKNFQAIWKQETGQDIDEEAAREYGTSIVGLVESVVDWKAHRARDSPT